MSQPYTTKKVPNEPVIIAALHEGYDMVNDMPASSATAIALLDQESEPVFYVVDLTALRLDLDSIINGANGASGSEGSIYRHPMVREVIFVSEQDFVPAVAEGLNSAPFGHVKARAVPSMDEAWAYIHGE